MPARVLVVGGGITGLAAAYELAARGVPCRLLEATDRLGGLIRTERVDGYTIDLGAESMLALKPAALALCGELGLAPRLISTRPPRTAYVFAADRLYPLASPSVFGIPTTGDGIAACELLPPDARAEMLRLASCPESIARDAPRGGDESVASFFRRQFGPDTVSLLAEPLLGGIHSGDVERLSIRAVAPRLVEAAAGDPHGCALAALMRAGAAARPERAGGLFRSLPGGMQELVEAIAATLPRETVRLGAGVASLMPVVDARWRATTAHGDEEAAAVVIAAPAHAAARMLDAAVPAVAQRCAAVPYVSTVSVAAAFPRAAIRHPLDGSGFVVARRHASLRISASTWVSSKWTDRAPDGMVLLRAFLGGAFDPAAVDLGDDELVRIAIADLDRVLGVGAAPLLTRVQRWRNAGAQHWVGHQERVDALDSDLERTPGLFVAGSGFHSIGVPDCIADGRAAGAAAANYVSGGASDRVQG